MSGNMAAAAGARASLVLLRLLLASSCLGAVDAIRLLKEGPVIDAEGREYKSAGKAESLGGPQLGAAAVQVRCTDTKMIVHVDAGLFRNGRLVSPPGEVFLGGYAGGGRCRAAPAGGDRRVIEAALQDCGSRLTISGDSVIYSNKLIFSPAAGHRGVTRTTPAEVPVSCYYKRTHLVSSWPRRPLQTPAAATPLPRHPAFSLTLMSDDWTREAPAGVFHLGEVLRLQAAYAGPGSRRVFVDSCVATLTPDAASVPRYYFIENRGCLTDAKQQGSKTMFRPRRSADRLQLQLDAFLFRGDPRTSIFITCQLRAAPEAWRSGHGNKACNYVHSRWENVDGSNDACGCCESACDRSGPARSPEGAAAAAAACSTVTLGPLAVLPSK